jgi:hypothetical protein
MTQDWEWVNVEVPTLSRLFNKILRKDWAPTVVVVRGSYLIAALKALRRPKAENPQFMT